MHPLAGERSLALANMDVDAASTTELVPKPMDMEALHTLCQSKSLSQDKPTPTTEASQSPNSMPVASRIPMPPGEYPILPPTPKPINISPPIITFFISSHTSSPAYFGCNASCCRAGPNFNCSNRYPADSPCRNDSSFRTDKHKSTVAIYILISHAPWSLWQTNDSIQLKVPLWQ